jgi:acyl transferase domain-containing protein
MAWKAFDAGFNRRRVALPTYPFQRQRYWIDESTSAGHPLLGRRLPDTAHAPDTRVWETSITTDRLPYLSGHRVSGSAVLPYAVFVEMALAAGAEANGLASHRVVDLELHHSVPVSPAGQTKMQAVLDRGAAGGWRFRVYNRVGSTWTLSASAKLIEIPANDEIRPDVLCRQ